MKTNDVDAEPPKGARFAVAILHWTHTLRRALPLFLIAAVLIAVLAHRRRKAASSTRAA